MTCSQVGPLDLAGPIELRLDATITGLDTAWIAILHDVAPDSVELPISGGRLRVSLREVDSSPGAPVVPVPPPATRTDRPPGDLSHPRSPQRPSHPTGHRLRLTLAGADRLADATSILGFTHRPVSDPSIDTVHARSRLLLPLPI